MASKEIQLILSFESITVYLILSAGSGSVEAFQEKVVMVSTPPPVGLRPVGLLGGLFFAGSFVMVRYLVLEPLFMVRNVCPLVFSV